jgi:hypothetical protein
MQFSRSFILTLALVTATPTVFQAKDCSSEGKLSGFTKLTANKATAAIVIVLAGLYIRLLTKSSAKQRIDRTWKEYFTQLAGLLDITQIATGDYWATFDKLVIGTQLKLIDKATRDEDDDGLPVTYKDKDVKSYPSGMLGLLDSYVLQNLKKFAELFDSIKKCDEFAGYIS